MLGAYNGGMAKFLQIGIDIDSPVKAKGTSPDIKLPDAPWVKDMEDWIAMQDSGDMKPGDGSAQMPQSFTIKLPFVGNVKERGDFFLHVKTVV